ncbi:nucleoside triphosphate pyrophosphohydrolase [Haloferacaceae archaeon DSL9]
MSDDRSATEHDKLVRDAIPTIIRDDGVTPITHTVEGEEYRVRLAAKLVEEAREFRDEPSAAELGDVLEVVDAIYGAFDFDPGRVADLREEKAAARGRFEDRIVLERTE